MKNNLLPRQAFGLAADLTQAMHQAVAALRRCARNTESRRQIKRLLESQAFYRDRFLGQALA